ncbi:fimbrial protein [Pseudomonas sp. MS19]|uniref:fimbrial protein n=1 Tax=Pseudomonas sp. MS19 TaxID=2579939 RepID=UPI0015624F16|nr:fimbrial protein [Pseudomonas sp. MS19]NRH29618.1 type 1 fimbrial protein [Pseudomonas sp. MS19]
MKKFLAYTLLGFGCIGSSVAYSADGIVQFNGMLTEESCDLSVDGNGSSEGTVIIPPVELSELTDIDNAEQTAFTIALRNCNTSMTVRPRFEADNAEGGYLINTTSPENGGAEHVQIALYNEDGVSLNAGGYNPDSKNPYKPLEVDGETVFNYNVALTGVERSTVGLVTSSLVYSIEYQ